MAAVQVSQLNPWTTTPTKTRSSSLCWLVPTPVVSYWRSPVSKTLLSIYLLQSPNSLEVSSGIGSLTGQKEALHLHLPSDPETDRTSPPVQISLAPGFSVGIKEYKTQLNPEQDTLQGDFMESHRVLLVFSTVTPKVWNFLLNSLNCQVLQASCNPGGLRSTPMFWSEISESFPLQQNRKWQYMT